MIFPPREETKKGGLVMVLPNHMKGKYVKGGGFNRLTNMRCKAKDLNKRFKYRNNWCINEGDCGSCHVAKYYEEYLKDKSQ